MPYLRYLMPGLLLVVALACGGVGAKVRSATMTVLPDWMPRRSRAD